MVQTFRIRYLSCGTCSISMQDGAVPNRASRPDANDAGTSTRWTRSSAASSVTASMGPPASFQEALGDSITYARRYRYVKACWASGDSPCSEHFSGKMQCCVCHHEDVPRELARKHLSGGGMFWVRAETYEDELVYCKTVCRPTQSDPWEVLTALLPIVSPTFDR